ncbi:MFS transporter [Roseibium sp. CAU 1637]|uniref:MFS transporter n=1 Tax=Roseibium limicola TaxID=2816037 RepID=A0A939ERD4_9HYPH|nr:MFS transporter [Roseibium limicola]MBO0347172.1 MFS transporter [Roseibium limicola]
MTFFYGLPRQGTAIFALVLINSLCTSSLIPLMSFFIVEGLGVPPWQAGFYVATVAPLSLLTNRWAGEKLDHGARVRNLLLLSLSSYLLATLLLTQIDRLWLLLLCIAPLMSLANMGSGIIFTFGRLYATTEGLNVAVMNSRLRIAVSLGWMIGPAMAYALVAQFGFTTTFLCSFGIGLVYMILWHRLIPPDFHGPVRARRSRHEDPINWKLLLAALSCLGFVVTNSLFVSSMPLFFIQETNLPGFTPGLSLSVKCLVEVFVIFASSQMALRFGTRPLLLLAAVLGIAAMLLFSQVTAVWHALAISVLEGIYYGLFAGLSITFVQSFAADRPGRATATYMNTLFFGGMIGGISMGFIASASSFQTVLYCAAGASATALLLLLATMRLRPSEVAKV